MGIVIEMRRARAESEPAPNVLVRCARCGAELWNLLADGRVRCAECEEECPLRTIPTKSGTGSGYEHEMHKGE